VNIPVAYLQGGCIVARMTFSRRGKRVDARVSGKTGKESRSAEEVVRELKESMKKTPGEDYRERSLSIHGLVCARCGREFDHTNRHLLTVHHRDGNHHYNPPDGSNWENLCVYCHENIHSRELLGDYFDGSADDREHRVIYEGENSEKKAGSGLGTLGSKLKLAIKRTKEE
jgi:hypothetical protein